MVDKKRAAKENIKKALKSVIWFFVLLVSLLLILLAFFVALSFYESHASSQHERIQYCQLDSDCAIKSYDDFMCGSEEGCFNKNENPLGSVYSKLSLGGRAACERSRIQCCKCENGRCTAHYIPSEC